jgi:hypothetical protein
MTETDVAERDAIFLSYATEDSGAMWWLATKLTAAGYRIWCDNWRLFGGALWPDDIDVAIKTRTFRMLGLVSVSSLSKPNPKREWTTALNVGKEREEPDFLIPLNLDNRRPTDLPWYLQDRQYIPFTNWHEGLRSLLRTLQEVNAPRPLVGEGPNIALEALSPPPVLLDRPERLTMNRLPVLACPEVLYRFRANHPLSSAEERVLAEEWVWVTGPDAYLYSFAPPPAPPPGLVLARVGGLVWAGGGRLGTAPNDIPARQIVTSLIRQAVLLHARRRGLHAWPEVRGVRFPHGLLPDDRLWYPRPRGKWGHPVVVGHRGREERRFRYHLGFVPFVQHTGDDRFVVTLKLRLWVTTPTGQPYEGRAMLSRRKHITKRWFNAEWRTRIFGIAAFLAGGGQKESEFTDAFDVDLGGGHAIRLGSIPIQVTVTPSIDETVLEEVRRRLATPAPATTPSPDARAGAEDDE